MVGQLSRGLPYAVLQEENPSEELQLALQEQHFSCGWGMFLPASDVTCCMQCDFLSLGTALHMSDGIGDVSPAHVLCLMFIVDIKNQSKFHSPTLWNTALPSPNCDINSKQGKCRFKPVPGP